MFQSSNYNSAQSLKLSEVLEDIGVNEEIVMKRRWLLLLRENVNTVILTSTGTSINSYIIGSQSEGTTTEELQSDHDSIFLDHCYNVMQNWSEWKQKKKNYLMIKDEDVTPGYCFLQLFRSDVCFPAAHIPDENHISDGYGRILLKNTSYLMVPIDGAERKGPSNFVIGVKGSTDLDQVFALPCNSWPRSASNFLERQGKVKWPASEIIRSAASNVCFVVATSSKISSYPDLEWRISTTLAERCLMFNLNITQIHCLVLMKMILKTFLNPRNENGLSSYICKTVLLHCIENTDLNTWDKNNLSTCMTYCLLKLYSFLQNDNCPHFMISENNLMAGQFTVEVKRDLLQKINDIIQNYDGYLLRIKRGDISDRLKIKLNASLHKVHDFPTPREIHDHCLTLRYLHLATCIINYQLYTYQDFQHFNIPKLKEIISNLSLYIDSGNRLKQLASHYVLPMFNSLLGSSLASSCIERNIPVSTEALECLRLGLNSDVTSGWLKLASVFYCTGDLYKAEDILRQTERKYHSVTAQPVCGCYSHSRYASKEFVRKCCVESEYNVTQMTSFCIKFQAIEICCVPHELRYEMMRSTRDDMPYRSQEENRWMDLAVIDSLTYLYFLQYKIYGYLQRYQDQRHALFKYAISFKRNGLSHTETALNLLGQLMEQKNDLGLALKCYLNSRIIRRRNNVANIHICKLLAKCVSNA